MVPEPLNAPIAVYTDGLPIVLPTEERVAEMLKGTSHRPDEMVTYQSDRSGSYGGAKKKGDLVRFQPRKWTATVEKVASCGDGRLQAGTPAGDPRHCRIGVPGAPLSSITSGSASAARSPRRSA